MIFAFQLLAILNNIFNEENALLQSSDFVFLYICTYIEYTRTNISFFADVIIDVTKPKLGLLTK